MDEDPVETQRLGFVAPVGLQPSQLQDFVEQGETHVSRAQKPLLAISG